MITSIFERKEIKYPISSRQHDELLGLLSGRILPDEYGLTTVCNIYFDTPDHRLIRESIEKPMYKEKLRLRTYGVPGEGSTAFLELKKKFDGIVYKRRETLPYGQAMAFLTERKEPEKHGQIFEEIEWALDLYSGLAPAMALFYDRRAYYGAEDNELRVTFDSNIRYRTSELDLSLGSHGKPLSVGFDYLMELKISNSMPLWLSGALDKLHIYPGSFSKYGTAYQETILNGGES
ncbi:MAG: polyphosphate polymerase domain-containing protein [Clostridia bacterium]|nr:polyphosphate polymerase domain-containing protein [Clostridia bacterium]